jgi:WD40 repeat protein
MYRRLSILAIVAFFLFAACNLTVISPTATATSPVTPTDVTSTQTSIPVTEPLGTSTDWRSGLEVICAENWSRLQLLKTLPAEIPLNHSAVAIAPDGKTLAIGGSSGAYILFIDLTASPSSTQVDFTGVRSIESYFNKIEYLDDGTIIANADSPYTIYHIDATGNVLSTWDGIGFALSSDRKIMIYEADEGITLLEIAHSAQVALLEDETGYDFSLSPDRSKIAVEDVGVDYIHTMIWDISNTTLLATLDETIGPRFSPSGDFLAAIRYDYENDRTPLKIFSPDGAIEIITLDINESNGLINRAPVWSVDGSVILAQVTDGSSTAWETKNWQHLEMPALQGLVDSFSRDGRILITRAEDGAILLWGVVP